VVQADTRDLPYHFHPGLRISQTKPLTTRELKALIRELSWISGLRLKVNVDGTILYDAEFAVVGGSAIARELSLGQCERYLNRMRDELGLPLRQYYFPKTKLARSPASLSQILQGELKFTLGDRHSRKVEESLLTFDIAMVVDTQSVKSIRSDFFSAQSLRPLRLCGELICKNN
jgi:hypothetical protein